MYCCAELQTRYQSPVCSFPSFSSPERRGNDGPTPCSDGPRRRGSGGHAPNTHRRGGGEVLPEGPQGRALGIQGTASATPLRREGNTQDVLVFCFVSFSAVGSPVETGTICTDTINGYLGLRCARCWRAERRTIGMGSVWWAFTCSGWQVSGQGCHNRYDSRTLINARAVSVSGFERKHAKDTNDHDLPEGHDETKGQCM